MSALLRQMLADTPAGLWPLADTTGTTATDVSGFTRNGTIVGAPTLGVPWLHGRAIDFASDAQYVTIPSNVDFAGTSMTVCVHVLPDTLGDDCLACKGPTAADTEWALYIEPTGAVHFRLYNTSSYTTWKTADAAAGSIVAGVPQQFVGRYDNATGTISLWKDGAVLASNATAGSGARRTAAGGALLLGQLQAGTTTYGLDAREGYVGVYPTALADDRIRAIAAAARRSGVTY